MPQFERDNPVVVSAYREYVLATVAVTTAQLSLQVGGSAEETRMEAVTQRRNAAFDELDRVCRGFGAGDLLIQLQGAVSEVLMRSDALAMAIGVKKS